jgi:hypothetical protein
VPHPSTVDSTATWRVTFEGRPPGRPVPGPSVDEVIDALLAAADEGLVRDGRGHQLTPEAVGELRWCLGGHVSEALGDLKLIEVRARHVTAMLRELEASGVSRRRLRPVAESIRTLYDYAIERRLAERNPAAHLAAALEADPDPAETDARPAIIRRWRSAPRSRARMARSDVVISLGLQLATIAVTLVAAAFLVQSL